MEQKITTISSIERLEDFENEYVYDIGVNADDPYFFANDILVHNSVYFSAYPVLRKEIDAGEVVWTKESVIDLYDTIAEQVSDTFPDFMLETFNVPRNLGQVIKSGREIVGDTGLFITKKRYAIMVYDEEGRRKDSDGPGKLKVVGLDLRRSDTPKVVQEFLKDVLLLTLTTGEEDKVIEYIRTFKKQFGDLKPWEKGSPKAVNNLTKYGERLEKSIKAKAKGIKKSADVPGHVMASINWNLLRERNHDIHTNRIVDGQKIIVCKLKPENDYRMNSVAYPVDEPHLPDWFTNLPFDEAAMESTIVDKKIENLLGVLGWDLERASPRIELMESLFDFN